MEFTFSMGDVAAYVQAVCAMLGLIVAVVTLVILFFYARDTRTLAEVAVRQAEEGNIPYLTVVWKTEERQTFAFISGLLPSGYQPSPTQNLYIVNEGRGPAISIVLESAKLKTPLAQVRAGAPVEWQSATDEIGDLAVGQRIELPDWAQVSALNERIITLNYLSISGMGYQSTYRSERQLRTFKKTGFPPRI
jgi:hypothetical protein